jgi:hypothetical protein
VHGRRHLPDHRDLGWQDRAHPGGDRHHLLARHHLLEGDDLLDRDHLLARGGASGRSGSPR